MKILAFGEILWDIFGDKAYIGGAPFNLASHCAKMGLDSYLISAIGNDFLGKSALSCLEANKINTDFILQTTQPTGAVAVELNDSGVPSYNIYENVAWDNIVIDDAQLSALSKTQWDVFCFGTLAQRSANNQKMLANILEVIDAKHIFFDINLRQNYYDRKSIEFSLQKSDMVKLNDEEALFLDGYLFNQSGTLEEFAQRLCAAYAIKVLCITKGADGAYIYTPSEELSIKGIRVTVADTVGAGDSFCAGFLSAFLAERSLREAGELAVQLAGFVASCNGAIPEYSAELKQKIAATCSDLIKG